MQIKNIKETKIYLRSYYKKFRLKMNKTTKEILDYKISERFLQTSQYKNSKIILIYVSKEIEVDTYRIIEKAFEDNKSVAVPKCDPNKIKMNFYLINSLNVLLSLFVLVVFLLRLLRLIYFFVVKNLIILIPALGLYNIKYIKSYNLISVVSLFNTFENSILFNNFL